MLDKVNNNKDVKSVNFDSQTEDQARKQSKIERSSSKDQVSLSQSTSQYLQDRSQIKKDLDNLKDSLSSERNQRVNHDFSSFGFGKRIGGEDGLLL